MTINCRQVKPSAIKRLKSGESTPQSGCGIEITWSDDSNSVFTSKFLRDNCPCATCLEKRNKTDTHSQDTINRLSLKVIDASIQTETDLQELWLVGNYAVGMRWGDNHDTGIYSYEYLRILDIERSTVKAEETSCCSGKCKRENKHSIDGNSTKNCQQHGHGQCKH